MPEIARLRAVGLRHVTIGRPHERENDRTNSSKQDGGAEIGLGSAGTRQPSPDGHGRQRNHDCRRCPEQHPHARHECAIGWVGADARCHGQIRHVYGGIGGPEQQVRSEHDCDSPTAPHRRREVHEHKSEPQGHRTHDQQWPVSEAVMFSVDEDADGEIGDPIPDGRYHVGCRGDADRQIQRVSVVEQQEEHDALPEEVEGEVAEREQQ